MRKSARGVFAAREIELVALDLLLLAIHEIDVVAEEQVQVLDVVARQLGLDRIEVEQQIVAERAHQREPRRQRIVKFVQQRAQHRKRRRLLAAFLFGEQRGQRLQLAVERRRSASRKIPSADAGAAPAPACD